MISFSAVILAAGNSLRMKSSKSKTIHNFSDKPILSWIIDSVKLLLPVKIIVVYSYKTKEIVNKYSYDKSIIWVYQKNIYGSAIAVKSIIPFIGNVCFILLLCGDVPLICVYVLKNLLYYTRYYKFLILTSFIDNPYGFGRILKMSNGSFYSIIEEFNVDFNLKRCNEINTGVYMIDKNYLYNYVCRIKPNKINNEYYFTDIIDYFINDNVYIKLFFMSNFENFFGINFKEDLIFLEHYYYYKHAMFLLKNGVQIEDPMNLKIKGSVIIGKDVIIGSNVILEGDIFIENNVSIYSNVIIRHSRICENSTVGENSVIEFSILGKNTTLCSYSRLCCVVL